MKKFVKSFIPTLIFCLCILGIINNRVFAKNNRIYGKNRYDTAVSISKNGWEASKNVVIATGEDYPDALCAGPLAKQLNAPILLVEKDNIDSNVLNEIKRLKSTNAYIIGGSGVVSLKVEKALSNNGLNCTRIYGKDRYETSIKIAKRLGTVSKVILAEGTDFPDVLSISPIACKNKYPILLSPSNDITKSTKDYLSNNNIDKAYVLGGTALISNNAMNNLPSPERILGENRYATNCNIINKFYESFSNAYIATGLDFPDALTGSVLASKNSSPIIIVGNTLDKTTITLIKSKKFFVKNLFILGGESVVSNNIINTIDSFINKNNIYRNNAYNKIDENYNLYNIIKDGMKNCSEVVNLTEGKQSRDEVLSVINKLMLEYPDYGDYIQSYLYSSTYVKFKYSIPINEVIQKRKLSDKAAINIINKIITPYMSDLEKERTIHDYIVNTSSYDYDNLKNDTLPEDSFTTYGILVKHVGVCEGYAKAMMKLLRMANVKCKYVIGKTERTPHAWNIVKIDGRYYHVDATFDDPIVNGGSIQVLRHDYFNINDAKISKDHYWDRLKYPICN